MRFVVSLRLTLREAVEHRCACGKGAEATAHLPPLRFFLVREVSTTPKSILAAISSKQLVFGTRLPWLAIDAPPSTLCVPYVAYPLQQIDRLEFG